MLKLVDNCRVCKEPMVWLPMLPKVCCLACFALLQPGGTIGRLLDLEVSVEKHGLHEILKEVANGQVRVKYLIDEYGMARVLGTLAILAQCEERE